MNSQELKEKTKELREVYEKQIAENVIRRT
jgi:hypothetical protein